MKLGSSRAKGALLPLVVSLLLLQTSGCSSYPDAPRLEKLTERAAPTYLIGPGDMLQIFVFDNPDLSTSIPVRPDGQITLPLIRNLRVAGLTPEQAAVSIQDGLSPYVKNPTVSVMVSGFKGPISQQIRVVGQAAKPQALQYEDGLTVLDVMIAAGGLTPFAAGNDAILLRTVGGVQTKYRERLADLLNHGDMSANAAVLPGDVLIIPQSWF